MGIAITVAQYPRLGCYELVRGDRIGKCRSEWAIRRPANVRTMRWSVDSPPRPFTLLVRFQIGEGKHEDAEAAFAKTRELTLRENGVIAFELHREARNANRSVVYERWKSLAALEEHLADAVHLTHQHAHSEI